MVLEALARDAEEIGAAEFAAVATAVTEAIAGLQATAVEALVDQRSREAETLANTDPLTGLANMRHLQGQLRHNLGLVKRYEQPFALLVIDVDGLKRVNDGQGHQAGDRVLVQVGLAMRRTIRAVDTPARIGGDEFCVLAPSQTAEAARPLAERLAAAVAGETADDDADPGVGASVGVVSCPEHGDDAEALLDAAEQAMYRAKAMGEAVALGERAATTRAQRRAESGEGGEAAGPGPGWPRSSSAAMEAAGTTGSGRSAGRWPRPACASTPRAWPGCAWCGCAPSRSTGPAASATASVCRPLASICRISRWRALRVRSPSSSTIVDDRLGST